MLVGTLGSLDHGIRERVEAHLFVWLADSFQATRFGERRRTLLMPGTFVV
jgi:hypothetical protein